MKIIYRQKAVNSPNSFAIKNGYLKELLHKNDYKKTTSKAHYHNEYEVHIILFGKQSYEISGNTYDLTENEFIFIPPKTKHKMTYASENLHKYSITFSRTDMMHSLLHHGTISATILQNIKFITDEAKQKLPSSVILTENRFIETVVLLCRLAGYTEKSSDTEIFSDFDRNKLAKKFISDNIEQNLTINDVALYCHLSTRQLTRIFVEADGISPAKYINSERMKKIGECVKSSDLSLKQISEKFSFNNEYYFNTAFKKYFGMPPMTYRKMFTQ